MPIPFFGSFYYGTTFYGLPTTRPRPNVPANVFVISEPTYNIIKWDRVTTSVDGATINIGSYLVLRTTKTNESDYTTIATVSTVDPEFKADTCYVDYNIDPAITYFYKILARSDANEVGSFSNEETDIYMYHDRDLTKLYSANKNSTFWEFVLLLPGTNIYETQFNVIPYTPKKYYLLLDSISSLAVGTVISCKINDVAIPKTAKIINSQGNVYFELDLSAYQNQSFTVKLTSSDGLTEYKSYDFVMKNLHLTYDLYAEVWKSLFVDYLKVQGDLDKTNTQSTKVYDNFMSLLEFRRRPYWTYDQYYNIGLGETAYSQGIFSDFIKFSVTVEGIKRLIYSITGAMPTLVPYKDKLGWVIYNQATVSRPLRRVVEATDPSLMAILFSGVQKAHAMEIIVNAGILPMTEYITKSNSAVDYLKANNVVSIDYLKQGITFYVEGVNFTVNAVEGIITWIGSSPTANTVFEIKYNYSLKDPVEQIVTLAKPANVKLFFTYISV